MYWGIPPEINAFRLTRMGAGPTAHVAQIAGFTTAATTHLQQGTQQAVTAVATSGVFQGSGGTSMLASALPAAAWMAAAAAHATTAAATIQAGVDAYVAAVSATISHEVVVANRVREAALEATNILGQNTPAIAEANAEYAEYWSQNALAMMTYLGVATGLMGPMATPLPVLPQVSDPVGALPTLTTVAGLAGQAVGLGFQVVNAGFSAGVSGASAGVAAVPAALGAGSGVPAAPAPTSGPAPPASEPAPGVSPQPAVPAQHSLGGVRQPMGAGQAGPAPVQGSLMESAQPMMGMLSQGPQMVSSALSSSVSQLEQIPSALGGQLGGLMGPLTSLAGGMSGGTPGLGAAPGLSAAGSPWSGLSGANGGFAGGGSAVSASLTKPSAGAVMGGPVQLPAGWWAQQGDHAASEAPLAGLRSGGAGGPAVMGPGMYGPLGAASGARRGSEYADVGGADKSITVPPTTHRVPVLTAEGVVYTGGQGG